MKLPFVLRERVRLAETDESTTVHHANYLVYAQIGRDAYLRSLGFSYERHLLSHGLDLAIAEVRATYSVPLYFDDEIDIFVGVHEVKRVAWSFKYAIERGAGIRCADLSTAQVVIRKDSGRATDLPDELRRLLVNATHLAGI